MPAVEVLTNVTLTDDQQHSLARDLCKAAASILEKPEFVTSVLVQSNLCLSFGGTFDPAWSLRVMGSGIFSEKSNEEYSKKFAEFFESKLDIKADRGYITFWDPSQAGVGYKGTTMSEYWKTKSVRQ